MSSSTLGPVLSISKHIITHMVTMESNLSLANDIGVYDQANAAINMYLPPVLIFTGVVCNCLVIKVMLSIYFRFISTSFYMGINAGVDNFSLIVLLTSHWINANFPGTMYRGRNAHYMCKMFNFFGWSSSDFGILLTAAMTLERSIAIMLPLKVNKWCTVRRAKVITIILLMFAMIKDIHFLFTSGVVDRTHKYKLCDIVSENVKMIYYWNTIWPWIHNAFLCIMFLIIIVSNIIIIRHVKISYRMQKSANVRHRSNSNTSRQFHQHGNGHQDNSVNKARGNITVRSRKRQILIMLLTDSITIVLCTVPFSVYTSIHMPIKSIHDRSLHDLIYSVSFYFLYINRCVNFYLYCLSGSRFRQALKCVYTPIPKLLTPTKNSMRLAALFTSKEIMDEHAVCVRMTNSFCDMKNERDESVRLCTMCDSEVNHE